MTASELNAEILRNMSIVVTDESLMKQLAKYLRKLVAKKDDTLMAEDEFFSKIDQAKKSIEQGQGHRFSTVEELDSYIKSL